MHNQTDSSVCDKAAAINGDGYAQIEAAIADLRPVLNRDGGDIKLIAVEGDLVVVDLSGTCTDCPLAVVTMAGIRKQICDAVGCKLKVVPLAALPSAMRRKFAS